MERIVHQCLLQRDGDGQALHAIRGGFDAPFKSGEFFGAPQGDGFGRQGLECCRSLLKFLLKFP